MTLLSWSACAAADALVLAGFVLWHLRYRKGPGHAVRWEWGSFSVAAVLLVAACVQRGLLLLAAACGLMALVLGVAFRHSLVCQCTGLVSHLQARAQKASASAWERQLAEVAETAARDAAVRTGERIARWIADAGGVGKPLPLAGTTDIAAYNNGQLTMAERAVEAARKIGRGAL